MIVPDFNRGANVGIELKPVVKLKTLDRICECPIVAVAGFASERKTDSCKTARHGIPRSFSS
jgi:hypothetical protein